MISDDECALWRLAAAAPAVPGALAVYLDWLLTHAPARGKLLHQRLHGKQRGPTGQFHPQATAKQANWRLGREEALWLKALGLDPRHESLFLGPLPSRLTIETSRIALLEPVLDQLPFMHIDLAFSSGVTSVVASPAMAKIRSLSFRAYSDEMDPDENYQTILRTHFGDAVLAAIRAAPDVAAHLEALAVTSNQIGSSCATLLATTPFARLRRLEVDCEPIGDAGAAALANTPTFATLQHLRLTSCQLTDAGALALATSPHLTLLEHLDLRGNHIGFAGAAALRVHLPALHSLVGV
jgi:hypothetical protein